MTAADPPFLRDAADRWMLGALRADDLPTLAIDALEQGFDSPKLRMLAGWTPAWLLERDRLFLDALAELGVETEPQDRTIARLAAPILRDAAIRGGIVPAALADALVRTFGPSVREVDHPLGVLYAHLCEALYFEDEGDAGLAASCTDMARDDAVAALERFDAAPGA